MSRRRVKAGLLLLTVVALIGAYQSDTFLFVWPEEGVDSAERKVSRHLRRSHDVAFLMTFNERGAYDWVSRRHGVCARVEATPVRNGWGRSFSGTRWSAIHTPGLWHDIGSNHTLSIRIKLRPPSEYQDILFTHHAGRSVGLKLLDGQLTFFIPSRSGAESISYPFTRWNEFVHIAAVADAENGAARLYENGKLMAEGSFEEVDFPNHNIEIGARRWYDMRDPLDAVVDDTVIWNRALSSREVRRMAESRRSAIRILAPVRHVVWRGAEAYASGIRRGLRYIDYFDPRIFHGRARSADIPEIHFVMRKRHARHFNHAHFRSEISGRRTKQGADYKTVDFLFNDKAARGRLTLDGSDVAYGHSPRKAFLLETEGGALDGMNYFRIKPPEDVGWIVPLLDARLARALDVPATRNGLCRVFINGRFEGIYYFEDDTRRAVAPDASRVFLHGPDNPGHWPFVFKDPYPDMPAPRGAPREHIPLSPDRVAQIFDEVVEEVAPLLKNDVMAPFSRRELVYRLRTLREELHEKWSSASSASSAETVAAYVTPFMVLGGNPAPLYIREDLNLDVLRNTGARISWTSSHPDIVDAKGRVRLPDGDDPVGVSLTARIDDGETVVERVLDFRVMPARPRIPALMIHVNEPLQKSRRVDARIEKYAEDPFTAQVYRAAQGERSGIKFRGNTSFWQMHHRPEGYDHAIRKMSFSIRFEDAHRFLNDSETKHIYLANGYIDIALLRNKLAYDLFKAMSGAGAQRYAPDISWAEVFVNGHYQGIYEFGTRIDRHKLGWERGTAGDETAPVLYKFVGRGDNFNRANPAAMAQKLPPRASGAHWAPYIELVDVITLAQQEHFVEQIERAVDVDAVIDWHLLLNLTENRDGINVNLYLARAPGEGERFFLMPWDYDKTFAHRAHEWYSNGLTWRLWRDHPDYRRRMAERWVQLRQDVWSEASILDRIDDVERHLEGYIEWDHAQWDARYARGRTLAEVIDSTRTRAMDRLAYMDEFFADRWPPVAEYLVDHDVGDEEEDY